MIGPVDFDYAQVQHEPCPYCPHDVSAVPATDFAAALADTARRWREFLTTPLDHPGGADDLRVRCQPDVWSAIEYACHVRDGLSRAARNVELVLLVDTPDLPPWDHEGAVRVDHYGEQHAEAVADDLEVAAEELAGLLQPLTADARRRRGQRAGAEFSIDGLARYALHEALHHLRDARAVVPAVA